tara:strand:+ start:9460 stop:9660 length:201 start_codon:yes stop_codon:yes gene_type:complete
MAQTTFSGPIVSTAGFSGDVTGADQVTTANLTATGAVITLSGLPTSDPAVAGQLWNNTNVLYVSAG